MIILKIFFGFIGICIGLGVIIGIAQVFIKDISNVIRKSKTAGALEQKYMQQRLIDKNQKKDLAGILLQAGKTTFASGNVQKAHQYLYDCIELCKAKKLCDLRNLASVELARCLDAEGKSKEALNFLSSLDIPQAYLLQGELLYKSDLALFNLKKIIIYAQIAMECEELKEQAQILLQKAETKLAEHEKFVQVSLDAMKKSPAMAEFEQHMFRELDKIRNEIKKEN